MTAHTDQANWALRTRHHCVTMALPAVASPAFGPELYCPLLSLFLGPLPVYSLSPGPFSPILPTQKFSIPSLFLLHSNSVLSLSYLLHPGSKVLFPLR